MPAGLGCLVKCRLGALTSGRGASQPHEEEQSSAKQASSGPSAGQDHSPRPRGSVSPRPSRPTLPNLSPSLAGPQPPPQGLQRGGPRGEGPQSWGGASSICMGWSAPRSQAAEGCWVLQKLLARS